MSGAIEDARISGRLRDEEYIVFVIEANDHDISSGDRRYRPNG